jgi:pyruvate-ferredoxin/flavodoxin oxidoreductase
VDFLSERARRLLRSNAAAIGDDLVTRILDAVQHSESDLQAQRGRVAELRRRLQGNNDPEIRELLFLSDYFVRKSVWIVGGDGWAYDIGFGGLDHIMASRKEINVLVLDTQVYSNTGGQCSKATPLGAVAKFAADGKSVERKDLGTMLMTYGHVYVASVAMGAKDGQTVSAFYEAESYPGPSIIIAYSHCIAHGYNLTLGLEQQKLAVASGFWPLFRYDPRKAATGECGFHLDSGIPKTGLSAFSENETRFRMLERLNPHKAKQMAGGAAAGVANRFHAMQQLAGQECAPPPGREGGAR